MIKLYHKRGFGFLIIISVVIASFLVGSFTMYGLEKTGIVKTNNYPCLNNSENRISIENLEKEGYCGDGICNGSLEETGGLKGSCPQDCICGNGKCDPGENPKECREDCCGYCGDGRCVGYSCQEDNKTSEYYCPKQTGGDCGNICGNDFCEKGETPQNCEVDCIWQKCGDGLCTPDDGGPELCPQDCAPKCGDCLCSGEESYVTCPNDCGYCGDLFCSNCTQLDENLRTCSKDCN